MELLIVINLLGVVGLLILVNIILKKIEWLVSMSYLLVSKTAPEYLEEEENDG